jgi:ketosteroid isomerase-like protein
MPVNNAESLRALLDRRADIPWSEDSRPREIDLSLYDPDVIFEDTVATSNRVEVYRGHEGMRQAAERWFERFGFPPIGLVEIVGEGDRFVSIHRWRARARYTGVDFDSRLAYVWRFRDGRIVHLKSYSDPEDALRSAGLGDWAARA